MLTIVEPPETKPRTKQRYSDADKANVLLALDFNANNVKKTARETGVPQATIRSWRDGEGTNDDVSKIRALKGKELSQRLGEICTQLLEAIPGKIADANVSQITTAYGTLFDKNQLVDGNPTSITESRTDGAQAFHERMLKVAQQIGRKPPTFEESKLTYESADLGAIG